jgi:hypothetical protein
MLRTPISRRLTTRGAAAMQTGLIARQRPGIARQLAAATPWQDVLAAYLDAAIDSPSSGAHTPATSTTP